MKCLRKSEITAPQIDGGYSVKENTCKADHSGSVPRSQEAEELQQVQGQLGYTRAPGQLGQLHRQTLY